ncbi:DUF1376 domain-containing protein [Rhodovulum sulfidophilum]|uniref:DUF1376 domain-containing protein n=1 Tax=Rhodovulum TaxID=34008 RepID=UPI0009527B01|nr:MULTISPECIES: DUF1376 domain-containing protein [Rhodovulum]OLS43077.1 DUF1376 domain-containing protein [Rhodovulum sulfidophilum]
MTVEVLSDDWWYPLHWGDTLSNHDWVPLYVNRLLTSDFVAYACAEDRRGDIGTALILWAEAFKQDPAGTLPDDDVLLAQIARFGSDIEGWRRVRTGALHGWRPVHVENSEGRGARLGHPVIAKIAVDMYQRKRGRDESRERSRLASMRSRVRERIKRLGYRKPHYESAQVIGVVTDWLSEAGLVVNDDNVRAAMSEAAGIPRDIVSLDHRRRGAGCDDV